MTRKSICLDDLTVAELKQFCDKHGITFSYCSDGSGIMCVSGAAVHQEGKGPHYHQEPMALGESFQETFLRYLLKAASIKSPT